METLLLHSLSGTLAHPLAPPSRGVLLLVGLQPLHQLVAAVLEGRGKGVRITAVGENQRYNPLGYVVVLFASQTEGGLVKACAGPHTHTHTHTQWMEHLP